MKRFTLDETCSICRKGEVRPPVHGHCMACGGPVDFGVPVPLCSRHQEQWKKNKYKFCEIITPSGLSALVPDLGTLP